jgi:UDP-N-acetylmuramoylalanine--D-glutamate ligase
VIGITGSAGKTTTTTLVGRMAEAAGSLDDGDLRPRKVWVGGNIGTPLLAMLDQMQSDDLAVMELSSFQLEIMSRSPQVAAVLNITPNHLDRHGDMQAYAAAKRRILDFQSAQDVAVLGKEDPGAWGLASTAPARVWSFGWSEDRKTPGSFLDGDMIRIWDGAQVYDAFPKDIVRLRGAHNLLNVLAACAIAGAAGISPRAMLQGVQGFGGVAHRLTFVRSWGGADWYNDSIASAPERAMAAIRSFDEPIVLLAGGRDKNLPWEDFARLVRQRVDHLVVFGEAAGIIRAALDKVSGGERPFTLQQCSGLRQAVQAAAQIVQPGDVVLLSPGGTSFDEFRDFEERGEEYTQWVLEL